MRMKCDITNTAQGLLFAIYFYNSKLFGLRAMDEHVEMERSQFSFLAAYETSKVDVDPRSFECIHDKPHLPRQSK